jgi:cytochrome c553
MVKGNPSMIPCWHIGTVAMRIAAAALIAVAAVMFTAGDVKATPDKVTKSTPCGSCHPPNKPPNANKSTLI